MTISIIHPSRGRPEQAWETFTKWDRMADNDFQYILSVDIDDPMRDEYFDSFTGVVHFIRNNNKSAIEAINIAVQAATGNIFIIVSDDFDCPNHWDTALLIALENKSDFCVKTLDGFQKTIMTLPILDRTYYNRFGYIYNPTYDHMYADKEMTAVAHMLGRNIDIPLTFTHNHYLARKGVKDDINIKNDKTYASGLATFNQRRAINFGLKDSEIVKPYNQIRWR